MKPRRAQHARHVGPERKAGRVVVTAPDEPLNAIGASLQGVVDIAVSARSVVSRPLRGATRNGQNPVRLNPSLDKRARIELALGDEHYRGGGRQYARQIPER